MQSIQFTKFAKFVTGMLIGMALLSIFGCLIGTEISTSVVPATTEVKVLKEGNGRITNEDSIVVITYTGYLKDGTKIDNSEGEGFCLRLGSDKVIDGIEDNLINQNGGTEIELIIPPQETFGDAGFGNLIPPNAVLIYNVDIINVLPDYLKLSSSPSISFTEIITDGISYVDIEKGKGDVITPDKSAFIHYACWDELQGQISSTFRPGSEIESDICWPFKIAISQNDIVTPLGHVLTGMRVGGERLLSISEGNLLGEALKSQLSCESQASTTIYLYLSKIE